MREYMDDKIALTGIVLIAAPIGESDKRLVLLTRERGKVTVFARGARRPGNPFLAAANTFAFGTFYVKEARTAYQLVQTEIRNYFREITEDVEAACYGSYFLEFADYYARENDDDLCAFLTDKNSVLCRSCVSKVQRSTPVLESTIYTMQYVISTPVERLFAFALSTQVKKEFISLVEKFRRRYIDRDFKSLEILEIMRHTRNALYKDGQ